MPVIKNLADIMTRAVVTVHMDDTLERIREIFDDCGFHHLVVIDDARVVGVISDRDLLKHLCPSMNTVWTGKAGAIRLLCCTARKRLPGGRRRC